MYLLCAYLRFFHLLSKEWYLKWKSINKYTTLSSRRRRWMWTLTQNTAAYSSEYWCQDWGSLIVSQLSCIIFIIPSYIFFSQLASWHLKMFNICYLLYIIEWLIDTQQCISSTKSNMDKLFRLLYPVRVLRFKEEIFEKKMFPSRKRL